MPDERRPADRIIPPPTIDPTLNVKEAMAAAVTRLDDIRKSDLEHLREMRELRERLEDANAELRDQLAAKESSRLDAIAQADRERTAAQFRDMAQALALATEKQTAQAASLAAQLVASAEIIRSAAAAQTERFTQSIRALEQNQFQTGGVASGVRQQQGDARATSSGTIALIGLAITLLLALMAVVTFVIARANP
jgi:hypothetical protein